MSQRSAHPVTGEGGEGYISSNESPGERKMERQSGGETALPLASSMGEEAEIERDEDVDGDGDNNNNDNGGDREKKTSRKGKDRFMVHNAALYVDLLDGSDWTEVIRAEKRRKKREALALHWEEEANERDMRDALRRKGAEDAKAVKGARRKVLKAVQEKKEEMSFRARNDAFFEQYRNIVEMWKPMERNIKVYRDRVREQIFRNWEKEVFLPSQREINRKVEEKCAQDTRPHLFNKQAKKELEEVLRKGSRDSSQSGSINFLKSNWSFSVGGKKVAPLTWKEKKDELWKSFLHESNRKNKVGGRSGLFLDVIDEVEYDPIAQRDADTIYYKKRTLPTGDVDQRRAEAKEIEAQYRRLAFSYRDLENKSCTGVLREYQPTGLPSSQSPHAPGSPMTGSGIVFSSSTMTGAGGEGSSKSPPLGSFRAGSGGTPTSAAGAIGGMLCLQPSPPPPPAYRFDTHAAHQVPHTRIPYDFAQQYHYRTTGSMLANPSLIPQGGASRSILTSTTCNSDHSGGEALPNLGLAAVGGGTVGHYTGDGTSFLLPPGGSASYSTAEISAHHLHHNTFNTIHPSTLQSPSGNTHYPGNVGGHRGIDEEGMGISMSIKKPLRPPTPSQNVLNGTLVLTSVVGESNAGKLIHQKRHNWQADAVAHCEEQRRQQQEDRRHSPMTLELLQREHQHSNGSATVGDENTLCRGDGQNVLESNRSILPLPILSTGALSPVGKGRGASQEGRREHTTTTIMGATDRVGEDGGGEDREYKDREHFLPVQRWGKVQLENSIFGYYVHSDGSLRPPFENKRDGGWRMHISNISFDHYNFPISNEPPHTGKRMCVYDQI